jgi:hypothetical protein
MPPLSSESLSTLLHSLTHAESDVIMGGGTAEEARLGFFHREDSRRRHLKVSVRGPFVKPLTAAVFFSLEELWVGSYSLDVEGLRSSLSDVRDLIREYEQNGSCASCERKLRAKGQSRCSSCIIDDILLLPECEVLGSSLCRTLLLHLKTQGRVTHGGRPHGSRVMIEHIDNQLHLSILSQDDDDRTVDVTEFQSYVDSQDGLLDVFIDARRFLVDFESIGYCRECALKVPPQQTLKASSDLACCVECILMMTTM